MKSAKSISIFILILAITSVYSTLSSAIRIGDDEIRRSRSTFKYYGYHPEDTIKNIIKSYGYNPEDMNLEEADLDGFSILFSKEISLVIERNDLTKGQNNAGSILRLEVIASDPYLSRIGQEVIQEQVEKFYKLNPQLKEKKLFSTRISPTLLDKGDANDFIGTAEFNQFVLQLAQALSLLKTVPQAEWPIQAWEEFIYQIKNWPLETSSNPSEDKALVLELKIINVLLQGGEFPSRLKLALYEAARDHGIIRESLRAETHDSQSWIWGVLLEASQNTRWRDILDIIERSLYKGTFKFDSPPYEFRLLLKKMSKIGDSHAYQNIRNIFEHYPSWKLSLWDRCDHLLRGK